MPNLAKQQGTAADDAADDDTPDKPMRQTQVKAGEVPPPATRAASSVFHLGSMVAAVTAAHATQQAGHAAAQQPSKTRRTAPKKLVDLDSVEIKKGVPIPEVTRNVDTCKPTFWKLAQRMEVGDFVELPLRSGKTMVAKARARGMTMTTRLLPGGNMGIWRLK